MFQLWNFRLIDIVWVAITIPIEDEPIAALIARANRLLLEPKVPILWSNDDEIPFPIRVGKHLVNSAGTCLYGVRDPKLCR